MTEPHAAAEELADLDEGLVSPERAMELRQHLSGCAACSNALAGITDVRSVLRGLPEAIMPAADADRLDRALRELGPVSGGHDEADRSATDPAVAGSTSTVVPLSPRRLRPTGRPSLAAAAALVVIAGTIGAVVVGHQRHHSSTTPTSESATAAGTRLNSTQPARQTLLISHTGRHYTQATLRADVPGLLSTASADNAPTTASGMQAAPRTPVDPGSGGSTSSDSGGGGTSASSGTAGGAPNSSPLHATRQAGTFAPAPTGQGGSAPVPASLRPYFNSRDRLLSCGAKYAGNPAAVPQAVDFARYPDAKGKLVPAMVFVFANSDRSVDVFVVTAACDGANFLTFDRVRLP